jgi:hypothetical protein
LWIYGDCLGDILIRENVGDVRIGGEESENTIIDGTIHVLGDVSYMYLYSDVYGDIIIDGDVDFDTWPIHDFYGTLDIGGAGDVIIDGNVYDTGDNYIHIARLYQFQCVDLDFAADRERWLTFGSDTGEIDGRVWIHGKLSGVVHFSDPFSGHLSISQISTPPLDDPDMRYGGVYFEKGTLGGCDVDIYDIQQGWIYANNAAIAEGSVRIENLGSELNPGVARILTGRASAEDNTPMHCGWNISVCEAVWPSADGLPAIYTQGDFVGSIKVSTNESYPGAMMPDAAIQIDGDVAGWASMEFNDEPMAGEIRIGGNLVGHLSMNDAEMTGSVYVDGNLNGSINCAGMASEGYIRVNGDVRQDGGFAVGPLPYSGKIEVINDFSGSMIINRNGSDIDGLIYIGGSLRSFGQYAMVIIGQMNNGAVVVDYDGWDDGDEWDPGAYIFYNGNLYNQNTPALHFWETMSCKGNINNTGTDDDIVDGQLDPNDPNALILYLNDPEAYEAAFPGLSTSMHWRADIDCDTVDPNDPDIDTDDLAALEWLLADGCCMKACQLDACYADIIESGTVDLDDLAQLLGNWGKINATREDGDIEPFGGDGDVDLNDLAAMMGVYGSFCDCHEIPMQQMALNGLFGDYSADTINSVDAVDTGGHVGGGFVGEVEHFVFDLKIQIDPSRDDDWIISGAALAASNGASLRLSTDPTAPDQYATFVAAPWTSLPGSATAGVAGAYEPADPAAIFTPGAVNLGWFDIDTTEIDGAATIMRIVIDVSDVAGADVTSGFGSVYFSTSGPASEGDILVAELNSGTRIKQMSGAMTTFWGEFYVKGQ